MEIREINEKTFDMFSKVHLMKSYYQTPYYGKTFDNIVFEKMYIGVFEENIIKAAALILFRNIAPSIKYGYSPRGFLIDFYNKELFVDATKKIKEFFFKRGFAFIKINPEVTYSILDFDRKDKDINGKNVELVKLMQSIGYKKLINNLYFESLLPKFNPIIDLVNYDMHILENDLNKKSRPIHLKSLKYKVGTKEDLEEFYKMVNIENIKNFPRYKKYYDIFKKEDMIDLFLIEMDYNEYSKSLQIEYNIEKANNSRINDNFLKNIDDAELYKLKMESDKKLSDIHYEIVQTSNLMKKVNKEEIIAGALLIKFEGRINLLFSGFKDNVENLDVNFFLYYKIIEEYKKNGYKFLDLNGITGNFADNNPFKELNKFKLQFKPTVYEYIGEFDLVVNNPYYQIILNTNMLKKEFNKEEIK